MTLEEYFGLDGRVALVTGAGQGIGRQLCLTLADAGCDVVSTDLDGGAAKDTATAVEERGVRSTSRALDVTDEASVIEGFEWARDEMGRLDIVVNNAGIYPYITLADMPLDEFESVYEVNVRGTFLCMREGIKQIRRTGEGGAMVNLSSMTAFFAGQPGLSAYGSSKAAIAQMTRNAALEFADDGVRVNAIAPGFVHTEGTNDLFEGGMGEMLLMHQAIKRVGTPRDLAGMVLALLSPAASFVTGQTLLIDGGFLLL